MTMPNAVYLCNVVTVTPMPVDMEINHRSEGKACTRGNNS